MKEIKILNLTFEIEEVPFVEHGSSLIGQVRHLEQKILIKQDLSKERKEIVLLHETLHSIFEQLGFSEEHDNEHLITSLATALYQVLKENGIISS